mmetsp:Transcript_18293/g.8513  ORF Transcript_18293/g.8513 Transcript_18293/m.8513 type:complete len:118 (+) Transcript_18293:37-390(+)
MKTTNKDTIAKTAEEIGKGIIKRLHQHSEVNLLDDADYIPILKRIIEAIGVHISQSDKSKSGIDGLTGTLIGYARDLYVELCQIHAEENNEDISLEEIKEESEEYFDYIYEHEDHPH